MPKEQDPDPHQMGSWIRVRVKMKSQIWIRIRIEVERGNRIRNTSIVFITTSVSLKMFLKIYVFSGGRAKTTASPLGVCTDCTGISTLPRYLLY
jgi:hypothetical protein